VLQLGNYVEEVLAGTNTDKIPTTAIVANPGFAGEIGVGGASAANTGIAQVGTLAPAGNGFVNGINQTLTLKPGASAGNVIFASIGSAIDTSAAGGAVAGGPASNAYFPAVSNSAFGAVLVASTGVVQPAVGSTTWITLEGITFDTR
jgi:hypothetical protein